jgi:hypothetical protein
VRWQLADVQFLQRGHPLVWENSLLLRKNVDIFKEGISVRGLVLKYMFQDLPDYFTLPEERNKNLYQLYKNNIVVGPSIITIRS